MYVYPVKNKSPINWGFIYGFNRYLLATACIFFSDTTYLFGSELLFEDEVEFTISVEE